MDMKNFRNTYEKMTDFKEKENEVIKNAEKYSGMGESELTNELLKMVSSAKNSGNFSYNELLNFANTMFPYLAEEQRARLVELLKLIGK